MERRKFLIGAGSLAAGGAAALGSGAFTSVTAQRSVSVSVADDSSAFLTLTQAGTGPNSQYASVSGGQVTVDLDNSDDGGGSGINNESETKILDIFRVRNEGTQPVFAYVDPDSVSDFATPDGGNGYAGSPDEPAETGLYIDPQASNRPYDSVGDYEGQAISMTGIYGVGDPTTGFESNPYVPEDLTLGVGDELSFGLFIRAGADIADEFDVSMNIVADADLAASVPE